MKKFLNYPVRIVVFILIFCYLFTHISYAKRPDLAESRGNLSGFYSEPDDTIDVIYTGNSGVMSAYMPMTAYEQTGLTSYNLSVADMAMETIPFLMEEAEKTQSPKLYVIDIRPFVCESSVRTYFEADSVNQVAYNTDAFKYSWERFKFLYKNLPHNLNALTYYFDLTRYHKEAFNIENWNNDAHYVNRGYLFFNWGKDFSYCEPTEEVLPISEYADEQLDLLFEACGDTDAEVLFIYFPYGVVPEYQNVMEHVNYVAERIEEAGYDFLNLYDFMEELDVDHDHDRQNSYHFNVYGSEKVTSWLAEYMTEEYDLADHRGETGYEGWEEDLPLWTASVDEEKAEIDRQIAAAGGTENGENT